MVTLTKFSLSDFTFMISIPSPFLAACRHIVHPHYRIHNGVLEARDVCSDIILSHHLPIPASEHPDTPFFSMRKFPTMDEASLTIHGNTLRYKSRSFSQNTPTEPSLINDEQAAEYPTSSTLALHSAAATITPDLTTPFSHLALAMSKDPTRYVLNGIYCADKFVSTDGRRLIALDSLYSGPPFIMPANVVQILIALHGKKPSAFWRWRVIVDDAMKPDDVFPVCLIETDSYSLQFRTIEGNFPNYQNVIPDYSNVPLDIRCIPQDSSIAPMATWLRGRESVTLLPASDGIMLYDLKTESHAIFPGYLSAHCTFNGSFLSDFLRIDGFIQFISADDMCPAIVRYHHGLGIIMPMRATVDPLAIIEKHALAHA